MSLPRVLLIDDQIAVSEAEKSVYLRKLQSVEAGSGGGKPGEAVAEVVFCGGQIEQRGVRINSPEMIEEAVRKGWEGRPDDRWSLVLLDVEFVSGALSPAGLPGGQQGDSDFGEHMRVRLLEHFPDLPLVMLTQKHQSELQDPAFPFLSKTGLDARIFKNVLFEHGRLTEEQKRLILELDGIVAASSTTFKVYGAAYRLAPQPIDILILGETGTGKEVLANYIHRMSSREGAFKAINMGAIPEHLVESELFGHKRGAFTGAAADRLGAFREADGGTLFLDEIGETPLETQVKLLRALQERRVTPLGSDTDVEVDVRVICATSRDLQTMCDQGEFREDLYYRIKGPTLVLPPLRQRPEDIEALAQAFVRSAAGEQGWEGVELSSEAVSYLKGQPFPGNVRELRNLIRTVVASSGANQEISQDDLKQANRAGDLLGSSRAGVRRTGSGGGAGQSAYNGADSGQIDLKTFVALFDRVEIKPDDPYFKGIKPKLEEAMRGLLCRITGAALERCKPPGSAELNLSQAMKLISGNENISPTNAIRQATDILGVSQKKYNTKKSLQTLLEDCIKKWKDSSQR